MNLRQNLFLNRFFFVSLSVGIVAIVASLLAATIFGLPPCMMCKIQRIPYALMIVNALFGLLMAYKELFVNILMGVLMVGVLLGLVHFLMQVGVIPDFCLAKKGFTSHQELLNYINKPKCSKVYWSIFGAPVSLLNAFVQGSLLGGFLILRSKREYQGG